MKTQTMFNTKATINIKWKHNNRWVLGTHSTNNKETRGKRNSVQCDEKRNSVVLHKHGEHLNGVPPSYMSMVSHWGPWMKVQVWAGRLASTCVKSRSSCTRVVSTGSAALTLSKMEAPSSSSRDHFQGEGARAWTRARASTATGLSTITSTLPAADQLHQL